MPTTTNQNPEQKARDVIDAQLDASEIPRIKKSAFAMDANLSPKLRK